MGRPQKFFENFSTNLRAHFRPIFGLSANFRYQNINIQIWAIILVNSGLRTVRFWPFRDHFHFSDFLGDRPGDRLSLGTATNEKPPNTFLINCGHDLSSFHKSVLFLRNLILGSQ